MKPTKRKPVKRVPTVAKSVTVQTPKAVEPMVRKSRSYISAGQYETYYMIHEDDLPRIVESMADQLHYFSNFGVPINNKSIARAQLRAIGVEMAP